MKVGILGVGRMGQRHLSVAQQMGLEVVGIHDIDPTTLDRATEVSGLPRQAAFSSAHELLCTRRPEFVIIATTATSHCELTCLASQHGARFILCEKPMAVSLAQCIRMISVCKEHNTSLAINHPRRFMNHVIETKRILLDESFGGLSSLTVIGGNMGLSMNGSHFIELFLYLANEKAVEITAWLTHQNAPNPRGSQYEDRAGSLRITTETGKRFYAEIGHDQGCGQKTIYGGRYAQLLVDEVQGTMSLQCRKQSFRDMPTTRSDAASEFTTRETIPIDPIQSLRSTFEAVFRGDGPSPTHAFHVIEILVSAYISHERGNVPVRLPDNSLPVDRIFPWA